MPAQDVVGFGQLIARVLDEVVGPDLVGVYFVGSVALGGYVPGESDLDLVAVTTSPLADPRRREVATAVVQAATSCPARGVEFTLYRRDVVAAPPLGGADFEVNANGGPRMPTAVHLDASAEDGFWYVLDRAIAHRHGLAVVGPLPAEVFADVPRATLLAAMSTSMRWHRAHEKATLYSVLNACRAWRFADEDVLGSKLEGAAWARRRWPHPDVIDAGVALRRGEQRSLDGTEVDALLAAVEERVRVAAHAEA